MLYLEDYLELIEHLPSDLKERFTDMREMDLQVQNAIDNMKDKAEKLFQRCAAKKTKIGGADQIYEEIKSEYYKTLEDADEKVQLANQIYDLVDRHLRKLDQELSKFKMELEADNAGITEILEQRSLELDNPSSQSRANAHLHKERRRHGIATAHSATSSATTSSVPATPTTTTSNGDAPPEKKMKIEQMVAESSLMSQTPAESLPLYTEHQEQTVVGFQKEFSSAQSSQIELLECDPDPIELSQAATSSQEQARSISMLPTSRRTSFVKSEQARSSELLLSKYNELEGLSVDALDTSGDHISDSSVGSAAGVIVHRPSRTKKQTSKAAAWVQERLKQAEARHEQRKKEHQTTSESGEHPLEQGPPGTAGDSSSSVEWTYDPNEPRYCICNHVSYGEMVGCDNEKCPIEWFHYGCVGLVEAPKGKWYCPQCTQTMKRRNKAR